VRPRSWFPGPSPLNQPPEYTQQVGSCPTVRLMSFARTAASQATAGLPQAGRLWCGKREGSVTRQCGSVAGGQDGTNDPWTGRIWPALGGPVW
jgi:hypothetical protein